MATPVLALLMGGSGSTRWGGHRRHRTERDAVAFNTAALKPMLREWLETCGTFEYQPKGRTWFCGDVVMGRVMRDHATGGLTRTLTIDYDDRPAWKDKITLTPSPGRFGGWVWFLHCPTCDRHVRNLYVPLGPKLPELSRPARCRQCCGLRYHTQRLSPERLADAMVMRAARRIDPTTRGSAQDLVEPPEKPKRMRWTTYDRLCERFDEACCARDDVYLRGLAAIVWRFMPEVEREHWRVTGDLMRAQA